jgi:hypothetical protein
MYGNKAVQYLKADSELWPIKCEKVCSDLLEGQSRHHWLGASVQSRLVRACTRIDITKTNLNNFISLADAIAHHAEASETI